jgi:hypothetical protein
MSEPRIHAQSSTKIPHFTQPLSTTLAEISARQTSLADLQSNNIDRCKISAQGSR